MDKKYTEERLKNIIDEFSKFKIEYFNEAKECKILREANTKLETELKENQELVKTQCYHLQNSREMIENLQETVSQLVYLKRDAKKSSEEIISKDNIISALEKDKETMIQKQNEALKELRRAFEAQIEEVKAENENKIQQIQQEAETQVAAYICANEELRSELNEVRTDHRDKMNTMVLEYEEKMQRSAAQCTQLQDQVARQNATSEANIDAYCRKIAELEEKLNQYQFKEYLANNPSQYNNVEAERPYSMNRETPYAVDLNQIQGSSKSLPRSMLKNNTQRATNALQVTYVGDANPPTTNSSAKKGQFKITKKRKLYTETGFQDF